MHLVNNKPVEPEIVLKMKRLRNDDAVYINSARRELRFLEESRQGKKSAYELKSPRRDKNGKVIKKYDRDGKLSMQYSYAGIRMYKDGWIWDVEKDIVNEVRQKVKFYLPPKYNKKGVKITEGRTKGGQSLLFSNLERCTVDGKTVKVYRADSVPEAVYLFECYRGRRDFDLEHFKNLKQEALVNQLEKENELEKEKSINKKSNVKSRQISDFSPSSQNVKSRQISDLENIIPLPLHELSNVESRQISDFISLFSGVDLTNINYIKPIYDLLVSEESQRQRAVVALEKVVEILTGMKAEYEAETQEKVKLPTFNTGYISTDTDRLKSTELDLFSEEREAFMKRTLERFHFFRVTNGLSENKSAKRVIEEMQNTSTEYHKWYIDFCNTNTGKKKGQHPNAPYVVEPHNVVSWYKTHYAIVDGRVHKKSK